MNVTEKKTKDKQNMKNVQSAKIKKALGIPNIKDKNARMPRVLLTGATGTMGVCGLEQMLDEGYEVTAFSLDTRRDRKVLNKFKKYANLKIFFGDLTSYDDVFNALTDIDIVLHVGAFVSPEADYHPQRAMDINYNSTMNIIDAIKAHKKADEIKLVYVGTIAETGDRLPPIHWGRVGDPIKPSVFDYYAVSKVVAERAVVESGLKYWVSLRQTGIMSKKMMGITDSIIFHNCLDNVLEYVSDRDSGTLLKNVCKQLPDEFWGHIYNIGGGESCRMTCYDLMSRVFALVGIDDISLAFDAKWFATRNFHGQSYLDSDKLEDFLHFRSDSGDYIVDIMKKKFGIASGLLKALCKIKPLKFLIGKILGQVFKKLLHTSHGTMNFIDNDLTDKISAYFISKDEWGKIEPMNEMKHFENWDEVIHIDHGYDESKKESELTLEDVQKAAEFRGGKCLSEKMKKGDWTTPLKFECGFGHTFFASPRLVLEGGHWCDTCESESWNYHEVAKLSPFFAQVWYPLHDEDELPSLYPKKVQINYPTPPKSKVSGKTLSRKKIAKGLHTL